MLPREAGDINLIVLSIRPYVRLAIRNRAERRANREKSQSNPMTVPKLRQPAHRGFAPTNRYRKYGFPFISRL